MAINWSLFEYELKKCFDKNEAKDINILAKNFSNIYDKNIKLGGDLITKNYVIFGNKVLLQNGIKNALEKVREINDKNLANQMFNNLFSLAIKSYWTGAILSNIFTVPPFVKIIINYVTYPGDITINITNGTLDNFVNTLINSFKLHLLTIKGQIIAISPPDYVPKPIIWTGYN